MGPRDGLDGCGKSRPTGIPFPDRPSRSMSLYRLSYPKNVNRYLWFSIYCRDSKYCHRSRVTVDQRRVLKMLESCITELYDRANLPENAEAEPDVKVDTGEVGP